MGDIYVARSRRKQMLNCQVVDGGAPPGLWHNSVWMDGWMDGCGYLLAISPQHKKNTYTHTHTKKEEEQSYDAALSDARFVCFSL